MEHRDLLVVGGGPAGLAVAIAARLAGLEVTVCERRSPPIDKACGEGLMPDGLAPLDDWGVRLEAGFPFRGIRYIDGQVVAEGEFPRGRGLGLRRPALHLALVGRAEELGVRLLWGVAVRGLEEDGLATEAGVLRGGWTVAADGLHSNVRLWAGLEGPPARLRRFGVRRHYGVAPWSDKVEVHWSDRCEAYVTPVGPAEVGVALLWSGERVSFDELLGRFPALVERLRGAPCTSRDRGAGVLFQRARAVQRGRLALVGDAAGYLDAITGEGLAVAFHQAAALVEAIVAGDLRRYERAWRRIMRLPATLIRSLLWVEARPAVRRRLMRTLAAEPALFSRLLAIHAREVPARRLGLGGTLRLVRGLVHG